MSSNSFFFLVLYNSIIVFLYLKQKSFELLRKKKKKEEGKKATENCATNRIYFFTETINSCICFVRSLEALFFSSLSSNVAPNICAVVNTFQDSWHLSFLNGTDLWYAVCSDLWIAKKSQNVYLMGFFLPSWR